MPNLLSEFDYSKLTSDPDELFVPIDFTVGPLPEIYAPPIPTRIETEPICQGEKLVQVFHPNVTSVSAYWDCGWSCARPYVVMRSGVAEALVRVAERLPEGFGLTVFDAWRPLELQQEIYEAAYADSSLPPGFVNVPSKDPATPPPHFTGGTVDLTLSWHGKALGLGTLFDDFTDKAYPRSFESVGGRVRELRRLLYWSMRKEFFTINSMEWWHFELGTREWSYFTQQPVRYGGIESF